MDMVGQFVLYNLIPSLLAGVLIWLLVYAAITVLRIQRCAFPCFSYR